ncbi:MAG TPA: GNAT family N-acetyltransferase [Thermomicrobiaceae bacterium]|nr:GNAT family N-acetyltransferase [Thermomicrobiaceae bacterium]
MEIRRAGCDDAAGIANVHVASWQTTYRGLVPDAAIARRSLERRLGLWRATLCDGGSSAAVHVAVDPDGTVVGFASGGTREAGPADFTGELYAIYLLREAQGSGLGRRLAAAVAGDLAARGHDAILLWVLAENLRARRFYAALGGVVVDRRWVDFDGTPLEEVAYGWSGTAFRHLAG